ncbi:hypothetical protein BT93_L4657 [Corymbia citriodora subsp. variegata]|uniref:Antifreeze protein n=1 Tax=Corymbia citriodora subsp. variegata TaxID=360336 RepID=A0A8T0CFU9_CORYI|nr:hypothetical protein BT93_L4657 [Corymbia citriodora subsp. variegata]KAF7846294.1 hypothetical protein BT93_L4657 [Corymbia citriodora subsp. variegata]
MKFTYLTMAFASLVTFAAANSCSDGINVCCGSASVSCSGSYCKACCGSTCGCFKSTSNGCNTQTTPCVNPSKPDFAPTNGECVAPKSTRASETTTQVCDSITSGFLRELLGCS